MEEKDSLTMTTDGETKEDTQSDDRSSSSKDSKDYRVGSCPSKIMYP